jgi:predicted small lipoprotein YifL
MKFFLLAVLLLAIAGCAAKPPITVTPASVTMTAPSDPWTYDDSTVDVKIMHDTVYGVTCWLYERHTPGGAYTSSISCVADGLLHPAGERVPVRLLP